MNAAIPQGLHVGLTEQPDLEAARHFYATQFGVDVRLMAAATAAGRPTHERVRQLELQGAVFRQEVWLLVIEWAAAAIRPAAAGARW